MSATAGAFALGRDMLGMSSGVSQESEELREIEAQYLIDLRRPALFAWRDLLVEQIGDTFRSCSSRGWDGYDAEPASLDSARNAIVFAENLPEGVQTPSVSPEPDGDIAFEWRADGDKLFSVSTTARTLVYAGRFGGLSKQYGEERFFGDIHPKILEILSQHFSES